MINEQTIEQYLRQPAGESVAVIVGEAEQLKGLSLAQTAKLLLAEEESELKSIFAAARRVKERIYGTRLVIFAPLYITNECSNDCGYCAFRRSNKELVRRTLSLAEVRQEVTALIAQGHKRLLMVGGESGVGSEIESIEQYLKTIYAVRGEVGEIRRVNVNVAPLTVEDFCRLKAAGIGTYQLFQETYHRATYAACHPSGRKADYEWRLTAIDRAITAGIDDVGLGALFGLYDYRFEALALLSHTRYLVETFRTGPHTLSVPRLEPAQGAPLAAKPPFPVSDHDFKKLVAILRLAVPYTGIILSTREPAALRQELFDLGVSQLSAGSATEPGGYTKTGKSGAQFRVGDHRPTAQVITEMLQKGYLPSFCTACYRLGRTGEEFMALAKPGEIQNFCLPNALLTLREYLRDFGDAATRALGEKVIAAQLATIENVKVKELTKRKLQEIDAGQNDLYL